MGINSMTRAWMLIGNASKIRIFAVNKLKFLRSKEKLEVVQ